MRAVFLLSLALAAAPCLAQAGQADRDAWLSLGLGPTAPGGETSPSGTFSLTRGPLAVGGRFVVPLGTLSGAEDEAPQDGDVLDLSEVALLVGYRAERGRLSVAFSGGPAALRVRERVRQSAFLFDIQDRWAPGLALQAEAVVSVVGPLGVGVRGVADVNGAAPITGLHGALYIGRF